MGDNTENGGVIPMEDFEQAIKACRRNPVQNIYYEQAPAGARLFIGLQFYATVHAADLDVGLYRKYLAEIEPDLSLADISYLIAHVGDDAQTLAYLRDLRDRAQARPVAPTLRKSDVPEGLEEGKSAAEREAENARLMREAYARAAKERLTRLVVLLVVLCGIGVAGFAVWRASAGKSAGATAEKPLSAEEAAQQAAERERREKEAAEARIKLQQERAAAAEAERLAQQKAREEMLASQRKAADEKRAAIAAQEAAKKRFGQVRQSFRTARYAFWQDARDEDRLGSVKEETVFHCLLPAEGTSCGVYELTAAPGKETAVVQLLPDGGRAELAFEAFGKVAAQTAHILMHGERAYLCPAAGWVAPSLRVPSSEELFNPFQEAFGRLYECARAFGIRNPSIAYEVAFLPKDAKTEVPIGTVLFGNTLKSYDFADKVSQAMAAHRAAVAQRARRGARNRKRTVVLTDGKNIRRRTDGVTEVPRAYTPPSGSTRRDGRRTPKEEQAYARWQQLYDEAVRQERLAEGGDSSFETPDYTPSEAEVEGVLREGRVLFRPRK